MKIQLKSVLLDALTFILLIFDLVFYNSNQFQGSWYKIILN